MNCRRARAAAIDRGLGVLPPDRRAALEAHLAGCGACARAMRAEERLVAELAALGEAPPLDVDVTARVLAAIGPPGGRPREEVSGRQLAWTGVAAAVAAVAVAASFGGQLPKIEALWQSGTTVVFNVLGFADALLDPLGALVAAGLGLLGALAGWLFELASGASRLAPFARFTVTLCYAVVASTVTLVLIRDLRRPAVGLPREDN